MPSFPEGSMNINSGVGDNAAGRYFGGSRRGGGSMFQNNRQMKQYMQMRRDEMSHGAFLQNQNDELANQRGEASADRTFNRESLRADANVQQNDWQKTRNTFHTGEVRKTDPNITSYKTDGNSFSFGAEPGLHATGRAAEERFREMQESGNPLVTPQQEGPVKVQSRRTDVPGQGQVGAPPVRAAIAAPVAKAARAPRAKREPGYVQMTLPGMRNTRQFKDTTLPPSTGSAATSTPITSGNETSIK
jgi:hypothetical protein